MKLNPNVDKKNVITKLGIVLYTIIVIGHHSHICAGVLWKKSIRLWLLILQACNNNTKIHIHNLQVFIPCNISILFKALNKKKSSSPRLLTLLPFDGIIPKHFFSSKHILVDSLFSFSFWWHHSILRFLGFGHYLREWKGFPVLLSPWEQFCGIEVTFL
jgi:hypothetical protein